MLLEGPCGSPDYSSPEVLSWLAEGVRPQQYTLLADLWSVGVLLYLMLCGFAPFHGDSPMEIHKMATAHKLEFPSAMSEGGAATAWPRVSPAAKRLIEQLLQQDPSARPSAEAALQDPWITGVYDSSAVRATIATLRSRFLGWSQLHQPSVEVDPPKRSDEDASPKPRVASHPQQISSVLTAKGSAASVTTPSFSLGHLSRWFMGRFGKRRHLKVRRNS